VCWANVYTHSVRSCEIWLIIRHPHIRVYVCIIIYVTSGAACRYMLYIHMYTNYMYSLWTHHTNHAHTGGDHITFCKRHVRILHITLLLELARSFVVYNYVIRVHVLNIPWRWLSMKFTYAFSLGPGLRLPDMLPSNLAANPVTASRDIASWGKVGRVHKQKHHNCERSRLELSGPASNTDTKVFSCSRWILS
jgi:hypothetical protein